MIRQEAKWRVASSKPITMDLVLPGWQQTLSMTQAKDGTWHAAVRYDGGRNYAEWVGTEPHALVETVCGEWGLQAHISQILDGMDEAMVEANVWDVLDGLGEP